MTRTYTRSKPYKRASDGMWLVSIELGVDGSGKRRRKTVARRNRNHVITAAREVLAKLEQGVGAAGSRVKIATFADYWLSDVLPAKKVKPSTISSYEQRVRLNIIPLIGEYRIEEFGLAEVRAFHRKLEDAGLSYSTRRLNHAVLKGIFKAAKQEGLILRNPVEDADPPKGEAKGREALTSVEAARVLSSCVEAGDPSATRFALALIIGARQGEVLGLLWENVDFEAGVIAIEWTLTPLELSHGCSEALKNEPVCGKPLRPAKACPQAEFRFPRGIEHRDLGDGFYLTRPKTKTSRRRIPMIPPVRAALEQQWEVTGGGRNPLGLVFPGPTGRPMRRNTDSLRWHHALERAEVRSVPLHSARHTAVSLMADLGVPAEVRMAIVGHAGLAVHSNYTHLDHSVTSAAMDQLAVHLRFGTPAALEPAVDGELVEA
ncbi:tyrosine-type recombinase/integrase [Rhodococcus sp. NPDC003994]